MSTNRGSTKIPLIFGTADFGDTRVNTLSDAQAIVDVVIAHGHSQFDTSNYYAHGASEKFLGQLDLKGALIDTKIFPAAPGDHTPEKLRTAVLQSVKTLGSHNKINVLYLHMPDSATPLEDTHGEINELFKQGHFTEFGLSNYSSAQVDEFHAIAKKNGWIAPTVYQGLYNLLQREVEDDVIHTLRKHNMRFYGYGPLASGLLARTVREEKDFVKADGSRWDPTTTLPAVTKWLKETYGPMLPIIVKLTDALKAHSMRVPNVALRWLQHHSILTSSDAILVAGTTVERVTSNLSDSEDGPLPVEILRALEDCWVKSKALSRTADETWFTSDKPMQIE